jgi:hypothetical protein
LAAPSFFTLELPNGVRYNYILSCVKNSGLHLVYADGFQLSVWFHQMTGDNSSWLLLDTFCIREACARVFGNLERQLSTEQIIDSVLEEFALWRAARGGEWRIMPRE